MSEKYTVGVDYGSLSARAVLMRVSDGETVGTQVYSYPHGILYDALPNGTPLPKSWALQIPSDYTASFGALIPPLLEKAGVLAQQVIGVGIDATSCTVIPTTVEGIPMCEAGFESDPHAYIKMWKHHGAQRQADRIFALAKESDEPWLHQNGDFISAEHYLPKAAQIAIEAPELFRACGRILELGDWLVSLLTGVQCRNYCAAGFKTYYDKDGNDVSRKFLAGISPELVTLPNKMPPKIVHAGDAAGYISEEGARLSGLCVGTPVSASIIDAHVTLIGGKTTHSGDMELIIGTSTCAIMVSDDYREIKGINGVVPDGIIKGMNAYEGGQCAVGDMFAWFCDNCVPHAYYLEAEEKGMSVQQLLTEKASKQRPGESGLVALDWINGVRSTLMDYDLSGLVCGITLNTKPEDIYRALIEATAYGLYNIVEQFEKKGVAVNNVYASGGIPLKNPMLMQIYADVFNKDITVIDDPYSGSVGSAILGLAAAQGGFEKLSEICDGYRRERKLVYHPIDENVRIYRDLYGIYSQLYEEFGRRNKIMKQLKALRG